MFQKTVNLKAMEDLKLFLDTLKALFRLFGGDKWKDRYKGLCKARETLLQYLSGNEQTLKTAKY